MSGQVDLFPFRYKNVFLRTNCFGLRDNVMDKPAEARVPQDWEENLAQSGVMPRPGFAVILTARMW